MAEYIPREDLFRFADEVEKEYEGRHTKPWLDMNGFRYLAMKLHAADVVEVCRCKDCKRNPGFQVKTKGMAWCRKWRNYVRLDDFCSYGERKEG